MFILSSHFISRCLVLWSDLQVKFPSKCYLHLLATKTHRFPIDTSRNGENEHRHHTRASPTRHAPTERKQREPSIRFRSRKEPVQQPCIHEATSRSDKTVQIAPRYEARQIPDPISCLVWHISIHRTQRRRISISSHKRTTSEIRITPMPSIALDVRLCIHPRQNGTHEGGLLIDASSAVELHEEVSQDSSTRDLSSMGQGTYLSQPNLSPTSSIMSILHILLEIRNIASGIIPYTNHRVSRPSSSNLPSGWRELTMDRHEIDLTSTTQSQKLSQPVQPPSTIRNSRRTQRSTSTKRHDIFSVRVDGALW